MDKFNLSVIRPAMPILHKVTGKPIGRNTEAKVMYTITRAAASVSAAVAATRMEIDGSGFIVVQSSQVNKPKVVEEESFPVISEPVGIHELLVIAGL